jgi:hypothetical protein
MVPAAAALNGIVALKWGYRRMTGVEIALPFVGSRERIAQRDKGI